MTNREKAEFIVNHPRYEGDLSIEEMESWGTMTLDFIVNLFKKADKKEQEGDPSK